jgi:hypothetical protein
VKQSSGMLSGLVVEQQKKSDILLLWIKWNFNTVLQILKLYESDYKIIVFTIEIHGFRTKRLRICIFLTAYKQI